MQKNPKNAPKTQIPVITVDGPSGSGKGTLSLKLARALKFHFLDSGALYRLLALKAHWEKVDLSQENELATLARDLKVEFKEQANFTYEILLQNQNVTQEIRSETCGNIASKIAVFPKVRSALLERQRAFSKPPGLVADGRDMGTIVFPEAKFKVFLVASAEVRANRRFLQLKEVGLDVNLNSLLMEIKERDSRDRDRAVAPLKPAEDAWVLDTDGMGIEEVFQAVLTEAKHRLY